MKMVYRPNNIVEGREGETFNHIFLKRVNIWGHLLATCSSEQSYPTLAEVEQKKSLE